MHIFSAEVNVQITVDINYYLNLFHFAIVLSAVIRYTGLPQFSETVLKFVTLENNSGHSYPITSFITIGTTGLNNTRTQKGRLNVFKF